MLVGFPFHTKFNMKTWHTYLNEAVKRKDKTIDINTFNFSKLYTDFNRKYFKNMLPNGIPITVQPLKRVGGVTKTSVVKIGKGKYARYNLDSINTKEIIISSYIEATQDRIYGIMMHEMIHVWVINVDKEIKDNHGPFFMRKQRELQKKTKFKIPITDDTKGLEVSSKIKTKNFYVILRTTGISGNSTMFLFSKKPPENELDRLRFDVKWKGNVKVDAYYSTERELLKYKVKRKIDRKVTSEFISDELVNMIKTNGKFDESIYPTSKLDKNSNKRYIEHQKELQNKRRKRSADILSQLFSNDPYGLLK